MKRWMHTVAQILGFTISNLILQLPLDDLTKHGCVVIISFLQGVLGIIANSLDKDGNLLP